MKLFKQILAKYNLLRREYLEREIANIEATLRENKDHSAQCRAALLQSNTRLAVLALGQISNNVRVSFFLEKRKESLKTKLAKLQSSTRS